MARALICALLLAGCEGAGEARPEPAPPAAGEVRYVLDWDDSGLDVAADGRWRVVNDLGIEFAIERGWLTSYSAQLVPCWLIEGTARRPARSILDGLWRLDRLWTLFGGVAHAGHDDEADPSLFEIPHVEALVNRRPLVLATVRGVPGETYCKAFYLVARADDDAVGAPAEVPYDRVSLYLEGTWRADGETRPFLVSTDLNIGRNLDLYVGDAALRVDPSQTGVEVVVYRRIAGWFDGLDPAGYADDVALARALMPQVVAALRAELR